MLCKEFNVHCIDHEESIKPQHLNKSRLHLNKRGTSVLSSNFIREISNVFQWQCILRSSSGEFDAFNESAEYKSKGNDINQLKLIRKMNLNKLVLAHSNVSSIRNKFEALIQNVSGEVDLLMISETNVGESFPKMNF